MTHDADPHALERRRARLRALDRPSARDASDDALFEAASRRVVRSRRLTFAGWSAAAALSLAATAWWAEGRVDERTVARAVTPPARRVGDAWRVEGDGIERDADGRQRATRPGRWRLPDGSVVETLAEARVAFAHTREGVTRVELAEGTVRVEAARTASRRLVVEHGPWGAWVHGTRFLVTAVNGGVRVAVEEGDVLVRSSTDEGWHVTAGEAVVADARGVVPEVTVATRETASAPPPVVSAPATRRAADVDPSLGERWVRDATLDHARGEYARALAGFTRYLQRHPRGALAEDALAGAMDARWRMGDRDGARRAAGRYLAAFPRGVATARARRILGEVGGGAARRE